MPKEHIIILIYLITVMLNMQSGSLQRAQHDAEKAFIRIDSLADFDPNPLLTVFKLSLLEHTIMCQLVMGDKTKAVEGVGLACRLCYASPSLMHRRRPQLHTLIGLYAMSMNCMNQAEEQFKLALKVGGLLFSFTFPLYLVHCSLTGGIERPRADNQSAVHLGFGSPLG